MRKLCFILLIAMCTNAGFAWQAVGQAAAPGQTKGGANAGDVKPEDVLRQMAEYYGKLPAFACKVESVMQVVSKEQNNKVVTKMTVRLQRPNKLAFIVDEGTMGMT